jgi:hypothetical protein
LRRQQSPGCRRSAFNGLHPRRVHRGWGAAALCQRPVAPPAARPPRVRSEPRTPAGGPRDRPARQPDSRHGAGARRL